MAKGIAADDFAGALGDMNAAIFDDSSLADWYAHQPLLAAEAMILIRWRDAYAGKSVLDLGVGSGRTTRFLAPFAAHYTGIDVSEPMLERARRESPGVDLQNLDLRALGDFPAAQFDFIFGPFNVLDALDHQDRQRAIAECLRLLTPGGVFVFSAHNRCHVDAGKPPRWLRGRGILRDLLALRHQVVALINFRRLGRLRRETETYALFNDISHEWRGVFYYIARPAQERLLREAGFVVHEVRGEDGRILAPGADDSRHGSLHFVCKRQEG